jgi:hypothetical protein
MKRFLLLSFLAISGLTQAQELPTIPSNGFSFSLGTKFTIKLFQVDSVNYNYSVIAFERFDKTIDTYNHDELFNTQGQDSTITFFYCLGTSGDNEKEKKKNMQVLLIMKNYSKLALKYSSDIQRKENGEFESTSNVGTFPNAKGMEMWPYMIYMIGIRGFQDYRHKNNL